MFKQNSTAEEIYELMNNNIHNVFSTDQNFIDTKWTVALEKLETALNNFKTLGMTKESDLIKSFIHKIAENKDFEDDVLIPEDMFEHNPDTLLNDVLGQIDELNKNLRLLSGEHKEKAYEALAELHKTAAKLAKCLCPHKDENQVIDKEIPLEEVSLDDDESWED